jgi:hypothetical protein
MSARVEAYLLQFRRELWNRGIVNSRIVEETREHLLDAIHAGLERVISVEAAESQAFARFGMPAEAAAYFAEENRHMVNRLVFMLAKLAGVKRRDPGQIAQYHDVGSDSHGALQSRRPYRKQIANRLGDVLKRLAGDAPDLARNIAVLEADLRERLDQFLLDFGRRRLGTGATLESLTLLADRTAVGEREGRYLAVFGTGTKMIWTVSLSADGTVSFNGTYDCS